MRLHKLLILFSLYLISGIVFAASTCTDKASCFNAGVDFGKSQQTSSSSINNNTITSVVGESGVANAQNWQSNIQSQTGGKFNQGALSDLNQAGNQYLSNCQGKTGPECDSLNFYTDPLTKQNQKSIESSIGYTNAIFNKQVTPNVEITSYCKQYPDDSICKLCKQDPSQPMCQQGQTCTEINSPTQSNVVDKYACQIFGDYGYSCNNTVSDIQFSTNNYSCNPNDGSCNQYINNSMCHKIQDYVAPACITWSLTVDSGCTDTRPSSCSAGSQYHYPGTCGSNGGTAACDGIVKSGKYYSGGKFIDGGYNCGGGFNGYGCAGNNWNCTNYNPGQPAMYQCYAINNVSWTNDCP